MGIHCFIFPLLNIQERREIYFLTGFTGFYRILFLLFSLSRRKGKGQSAYGGGVTVHIPSCSQHLGVGIGGGAIPFRARAMTSEI
jgi:hypothetical protein